MSYLTDREEAVATDSPTEPGERRRTGRAGCCCLAGILVVAAVLRFYALADTGILSIDEGRYFLDGLSKYIELHGCFEMVRGKVAELRGGPEFLLSDCLPDFSHDLREVHPFSPKLGFNYLTALVMACLGVTVHAGNVVEALSGVLMVWVLFVYVRSLHSTRAGLISAAILALSSYHTYFSRNAYPQSSSVLLLLMALWIHLKWDRGGRSTDAGGMCRLVGCGVFAGLSFWVNYQAAGAMPCLVLVHFMVCAGGASYTARLKAFALGGLAIAVGFLAVMLTAEAASYPMMLLFRSQGMAYPHATFFELLWPRVAAQSSVPVGLTGLLLFPYFLYVIEGAIGALAACIVLTVGACLAVLKLKREGIGPGASSWRLGIIYLGVPLAVPFLVFSLKTMQGARMFTYALPFFVGILAIAASAMWGVSGGRRAPRFLLAALVGSWIGVGMVRGFNQVEVLSIRSGYPRVVAFVEEKNAPGASAVWDAAFRSYLIAAGLKGGSAQRYATGVDVQMPYCLTDWHELLYRRYPDESPFIVAGASRVETEEHAFGRVFLRVEAFPAYGRALDNIRWAEGLDLERARAIPIYALPPADGDLP